MFQINHIFNVIKGQFRVMDYISNTIMYTVLMYYVYMYELLS